MRTFGALCSAPRWLVASHGWRLYYLARRTRSYRVSGKLLSVVSCPIDMAYNTDTACKAWATAAEGCFIPNKSPLRLRSRSAMRSTPLTLTLTHGLFPCLLDHHDLTRSLLPLSSDFLMRRIAYPCRGLPLGWLGMGSPPLLMSSPHPLASHPPTHLPVSKSVAVRSN